jgi:hypothetical protein
MDAPPFETGAVQESADVILLGVTTKLVGLPGKFKPSAFFVTVTMRLPTVFNPAYVQWFAPSVPAPVLSTEYTFASDAAISFIKILYAGYPEFAGID